MPKSFHNIQAHSDFTPFQFDALAKAHCTHPFLWDLEISTNNEIIYSLFIHIKSKIDYFFNKLTTT